MQKRYVLYILLLAAFFLTCKTSMTPVDTSGRQIQPNEVTGFHSPVNMRIAWYPYKDLTIKQTAKNEWMVVKNDPTAKQGAMPVILLDYMNGEEVWIDMNTDNETLGKLIKHTLMTEEPIQKPFSKFFEVARCDKCHPQEVDKGF